MVVDPICGQVLDPDSAPFELFVGSGQRFFFCSDTCAMHFREHPELAAAEFYDEEEQPEPRRQPSVR